MKKFAEEHEPTVGVREVAHPVQVRFTLGVIPPHVARLLVVLESFVSGTFAITAP